MYDEIQLDVLIMLILRIMLMTNLYVGKNLNN